MLEKGDLGKYAVISLVLVGLVVILLLFRGGPTGFAVFGDSGNDFDLGTYENTEYNNTGVMLKYWNSGELELPDNKANDGYIDMTGNVLLMHMNEASGTIEDTSGENNDGTNNGVSYGVTGILNTALDFDGTVDNYVTVSMIRASETYTVGMWLYFKESKVGYLFDARYGGGEGYCYQNGLNLIKSSGTIYIDGVASSTITLNKWHYVVVKDITLNIPSNLKIGRLGVSSSAYINADIDEVAIWNRSLSTNEISEIYKRKAENIGYGGGNNGTYTSQIFDAGDDASWNNLSSVSNQPNIEYLYAVDGGGDIYKSVDLGVSWELIKEDYGRNSDTSDLFTEGLGSLYIVATSNKEIWKSSDNGLSWVVVSEDFSSAGTLFGKPDSNNIIYLATASGEIFSSEDFGINWSSVGDANGGASNNPKGLGISSSDDLFLVDGAGDVYSSIDLGVNWTKVNDGYGGGAGTGGLDVDSYENIYILNNKQVYKSSDGGINWGIVSDSFTPYSNDGCKMFIDEQDNIFIADCSGRIFKSIDYGVNFSELGDCNLGASNDILGLSFLIDLANLSFYARSCDDSLCSGESWVSVNDFSSLGVSNNRYFQYKVDFTSPDSSISPSLESVSIDYSLINSAPIISIASPQEGTTYGYNTSLALDYSVSDADDNLQSCWYNLDNGNNISLPGCLNISFDVSEESHILNIYANDTEGLESSDSVSFDIAVGSPTVVLNSPIDVYFNNGDNIEFNYTPTDIDLDYCELWGNFNGEFKLNQTDSSPVSGSENTFNLNLSDGTYLWNIRCVDDMGNSVFNGNKTFYVDTTAPMISLVEPTGTKTSRTVSASWSVSDASPMSCKYNVYQGASLEIINTFVDCSLNTVNFDVTVDANFVFNFYVNDSAGNANSINSSFLVDTSVPVSPPSGGSGGGGGSYVLPNQSGKLEVSLIGNIIAHPGDNKKIPLNVKNIGRVFLNKCRLIAKGDIGSWVYSDNVEGIAPGQNIDFAFDLNVPEGITLEISKGILELKCEEASEVQNISVSLPKEFGLIEIKEIKQEGDILRINYALDSSKFVGESIAVEIWFTDENNTELIKIYDKVPMDRDGLIERNIEMQLPKDLEGGVYFVYFAFPNDAENFIKEPVVLSITGKAVLDSDKGKFGVYVVFLLILGVVVFFIWRRHGKPDKIEKKKHNNLRKSHWLLRKKK